MDDVILSFESPESSTIGGANYDPDTQQLTVEFRHRSQKYKYEGVKPDVWAEFVSSTSKGNFFSHRVRPFYIGVKA